MVYNFSVPAPPFPGLRRFSYPELTLSEIMGEIQVKVKAPNESGGYINMDWREARMLMAEARENPTACEFNNESST